MPHEKNLKMYIKSCLYNLITIVWNKMKFYNEMRIYEKKIDVDKEE